MSWRRGEPPNRRQWRKVRLAVLDRDAWTCTACGKMVIRCTWRYLGFRKTSCLPVVLIGKTINDFLCPSIWSSFTRYISVSFSPKTRELDAFL